MRSAAGPRWVEDVRCADRPFALVASDLMGCAQTRVLRHRRVGRHARLQRNATPSLRHFALTFLKCVAGPRVMLALVITPALLGCTIRVANTADKPHFLETYDELDLREDQAYRSAVADAKLLQERYHSKLNLMEWTSRLGRVASIFSAGLGTGLTAAGENGYAGRLIPYTAIAAVVLEAVNRGFDVQRRKEIYGRASSVIDCAIRATSEEDRTHYRIRSVSLRSQLDSTRVRERDTRRVLDELERLFPKLLGRRDQRGESTPPTTRDSSTETQGTEERSETQSVTERAVGRLAWQTYRDRLHEITDLRAERIRLATSIRALRVAHNVSERDRTIALRCTLYSIHGSVAAEISATHLGGAKSVEGTDDVAPEVVRGRTLDDRVNACLTRLATRLES